MKTIIFLSLLVAHSTLAEDSGQQHPEITVTPVPVPTHPNKMPWLDRALERAWANGQRLQAERGERPHVQEHSVELKWPARKAINVDTQQIQYLSMYLDQQTGNGLLDWNCGDRTYEGHNGTDIGIGPHAWWRMRQDQGIAVAAAPGTIWEITDDFAEDSCDSNQKDGNSVVIEHDDGSLGVYAHIRTGSATHKKVGDYDLRGQAQNGATGGEAVAPEIKVGSANYL
jgi:hypothetical protein